MSPTSTGYVRSVTDETRPDETPPDPDDPTSEEVEAMDPDAPGRSLFDEDADAVEPNEPA